MERPEVPVVDYSAYTNRQLVVVPLTLLAIALVIISGTWMLTGSPVHLGVDFTGGVETTIEADATEQEVAATFDPEPESVTGVIGEDNRYIVTFRADEGGGAEAQSEEIRGQAEAAGYDVLSIGDRSAAFGGDIQRQALIGVAVAFLGMSVLVALIFRSFVPSIAIVASAFSDIMIPLALMNLLGIELSLGTVAALLMLIGYSVDSDILLNNHILRRRGDFYESTHRAMTTGVTMTTTSIVAMAVMTVVATVFQIPLLPAVGIVLVFGLCADLMNTYLLNVTLLRYYKYEGVGR